MASGMSAGKRTGLGRGLDALITKTDVDLATSQSEVIDASPSHVQQVQLHLISPNPHQPRTVFDAESLQELASSIQEHGVIQPLIVTRATDGDASRYWLVAGERRWRAAQLAELDTVPVLVREASPRQLMEWALVENIQREDLNPLEEAAAFQSLMEEYHLTQSQVAERVGKSRSAIANTVRLLQLPQVVQEALLGQKLSAGHARALIPLEDSEKMDKALAQIVQHDLSVRQTEALVRNWLSQPDEPLPEASTQPTDPLAGYWRTLEDTFRNALGTRVTLDRKEDGAGRLIVHFYNDEDLDNLLRHIAGEELDEAEL